MKKKKIDQSATGAWLSISAFSAEWGSWCPQCLVGVLGPCAIISALARLISSRSAAIFTSSCLDKWARYSTIFERRCRLPSSTSSMGWTNSMPAAMRASSDGRNCSRALAILSFSICSSCSVLARSWYRSFLESECFLALGSNVSMQNSSWMWVARIFRSISSSFFSILYCSWPKFRYWRRNTPRYSWWTSMRRSASSLLVWS
mmetsp:Transcript_151735/g.265161  ORF Transcript_151735/g.265161 Transcript_151735/m.265161 type:complete len:203 (-) Transcript_151735:292-900(-)